jgi:hypothetical protein
MEEGENGGRVGLGGGKGIKMLDDRYPRIKERDPYRVGR